jgi:hypothetical protein
VSFKDLLLTYGQIPAEVQLRLVHEYPELATSEHLAAETIEVLVTQPLDAHLAKTLYTNPLTSSQIDTVLTRERRTGPLESLLHTQWSSMTAAQHDKMVKLARGGLADWLFRHGNVDRASIVPRCSPSTRLLALAVTTPDEVPDDTVVKYLTDPKAVPARAYALRAWVCKALCAGRPELMDILLGDARTLDSFLTAAAGSLHLGEDRQRLLLSNPGLTTWSFRTLLANPRVAAATRDEVIAMIDRGDIQGDAEITTGSLRDQATRGPKFTLGGSDTDDTAAIAAAVERAMPNRFNSVGRPFDLLALSTYTHLGQNREQVLAELDTFGEALDNPAHSIPAWLHAAAVTRLGATPTVTATQRPAEPEIDSYTAWDACVHPYDLSTIAPHRVAAMRSGTRRAVALDVSQMLGSHPDVWRFVLETGDRFTNPVTQLVVLAKASVGT